MHKPESSKIRTSPAWPHGSDRPARHYIRTYVWYVRTYVPTYVQIRSSINTYASPIGMPGAPVGVPDVLVRVPDAPVGVLRVPGAPVGVPDVPDGGSDGVPCVPIGMPRAPVDVPGARWCASSCVSSRARCQVVYQMMCSVCPSVCQVLQLVCQMCQMVCQVVCYVCPSVCQVLQLVCQVRQFVCQVLRTYVTEHAKALVRSDPTTKPTNQADLFCPPGRTSQATKPLFTSCLRVLAHKTLHVLPGCGRPWEYMQAHANECSYHSKRELIGCVQG